MKIHFSKKSINGEISYIGDVDSMPYDIPFHFENDIKFKIGYYWIDTNLLSSDNMQKDIKKYLNEAIKLRRDNILSSLL